MQKELKIVSHPHKVFKNVKRIGNCDSRSEYERLVVLKTYEITGKIKDLKHHENFSLYIDKFVTKEFLQELNIKQLEYKAALKKQRDAINLQDAMSGIKRNIRNVPRRKVKYERQEKSEYATFNKAELKKIIGKYKKDILTKDEFLAFVKELSEAQLIHCKVHVADYESDFTYKDSKGKMVVEDNKGGCATYSYLLKKKLMEAIYDIDILET